MSIFGVRRRALRDQVDDLIAGERRVVERHDLLVEDGAAIGGGEDPDRSRCGRDSARGSGRRTRGSRGARGAASAIVCDRRTVAISRAEGW